jgi:hypothetical protein
MGLLAKSSAQTNDGFKLTSPPMSKTSLPVTLQRIQLRLPQLSLGTYIVFSSNSILLAFNSCSWLICGLVSGWGSAINKDVDFRSICTAKSPTWICSAIPTQLFLTSSSSIRSRVTNQLHNTKSSIRKCQITNLQYCLQ